MFQTAIHTHADMPAFLRAVPAAHELRAPAGTAAHAGLALRVLAGVWQTRPVLWISATPDWYPPGLAWAGIYPTHCLFAQSADDEEALGAAEVALRGGLAVVVECQALPRLAARRLALAAKQGNALGLVLRHVPAHTAQDSAAFTSRWMVHPAPGSPLAPRLRAELLYAKGAMPAKYLFKIEEEQNAPLSVPGLRQAG